ncbi:MAG: glycoside hydrolase family 25 protein [Lachnospiraceae bacterium]|nr:glycoside hydrolase family 25 protein [Lachnospiraceae bacterium]
MKKGLLKILCICLSACILATSMPVTEIVYAAENTDGDYIIGEAATGPTEEPAEEVMEEQTEEQTEAPTEELTAAPTEEPTAEFTAEPTEEPTAEATEEPTAEEPTAEATEEPTVEPAEEPTAEPTTGLVTEQQITDPYVEELLHKVRVFYPGMYIDENGFFAYVDRDGVLQTYDPYDPEFAKYMLSHDLVTLEETEEVDLQGVGSSVSPFTGKTYTHESHVANKIIRHGIDVSRHQGSIDWSKVKADGVEFAIIRVGYRGYGAEGNMMTDDKAVQNIKNAYNAGIKIGVYFFSQAITKAEAKEEAQYAHNVLKNNNLQKYVTLPVFMDYEYSPTGTSGRLYDAHLSDAQRQAICDQFATTIKGYGYEPGVYANYAMLTDDMQPTASSSYSEICYWIARYNTATHYANKYSFWQYSSQGRVDGITQNTVDCNFWYDNRKNINDGSVTINIPEECDYVSDLGSILTVYDNARKYTLKEDKDYNLSVKTQEKDGKITATITITGKGTYEGALSRSTVMTKVSLHESMISTIPKQTFTGSEITTASGLPVVISHAGVVLEEGKDYTLSYENNVNAGTAEIPYAKVIIEGKGYYDGTVSKTFTIAPKSITADMLSTLPEVIFTGSKVTLETMGLSEDFVFVSRNSGQGGQTVALLPDADYTVSYENNLNVGTTEKPYAKVIVTGKGNYGGKATATFKIVKRAIGNEAYEPLQDVVITVGGTTEPYQTVYTGSAIKPAVTVTVNGRKLKTTEYSVAYSSNTKVSEKACITIKGKGNYSGTVKKYFTITAKPATKIKITSAMVFLESNVLRMSSDSMAPDLEPVVWVSRSGKKLTENTDYTLAYTDADKNVTDSISEAGIYYVKVTGIGAYSSTVYKKLEVLDTEKRVIGKDYSAISLTSSKEIVYTGAAKKPAVTVLDKTLDNKKLKKDVDYTISYSDNKNAGTARYTIKGKGKYTGTYTGTFQIKPVNLGDMMQEGLGNPIVKDDVTIRLSKYIYTYNGKKQTPTVTVKYKGKTLKNNTDFTIDYEALNHYKNSDERIGADDYLLDIVFKGNFKGEALAGYRINPVNVSKLSVIVPKQLYNGQPHKPALQDMTVKLGDVTLGAAALAELTVDEASYVNNVKVSTTSRKAAVTLKVKGGAENFISGGTKKVSFTIAKRPISNKVHNFTIGGEAVSGSKSNLKLIYTGSSFKQTNGAGVVVYDTETGTTLSEGTDYKLSYSNNKNVGTAKVVVTGIGGYSGTKSITFKILGKPIGNGTANDGYRVGIGKGEASYVYTGKAVKPAVSLYEGTKKLKKDTDYTVKYEKNTNAGQAVVTVTGKGKYAGTIMQNFTIRPMEKADAGSVRIGSITTQQSTGASVVVPEVKVVVNDKTLVKGKDYTVSVINSTRFVKQSDGSEKATATAIITGTGNYKGLLGKKNFTVKKVRG